MAHIERQSSHSEGDTTQSKNKSSHTVVTHETSQLSFAIDYIRPTLCQVTVTVPAQIVDAMYHEAAVSQQRTTQAIGFNRGEVPLAYIKQNHQEHLMSHLKEFLFKYAVSNYLHGKIRTEKLVVAGDPRLTDMSLAPGTDATFQFELTLFPELTIYEWKYFPFKAPKRKNYKDLDRQVETFVQDEKDKLTTLTDDELTMRDWVSFDITIVDENHQQIVENSTQNFWFRLGSEETESPLLTIFLKKKMGDVFYTNNKGLQDYFSDQLNTDYHFRIAITNTLPYDYFCLEQFKKNFRIKTNKDMHKKLIEVFSYRNDISQRRAMAEESLKLLLNKHHFTIPNHLILRQQKKLIDIIRHNPDYNVYRAQKDFQARVKQLAEKQVKEAIFIDKLAYHENIAVSDCDIKSYLNLTNRPRMKEFIYFNLPSFKIQGQEVPIPTEELKRTCLREKTINHIIYYLTKK